MLRESEKLRASLLNPVQQYNITSGGVKLVHDECPPPPPPHTHTYTIPLKWSVLDPICMGPGNEASVNICTTLYPLLLRQQNP